MAKFYFTYGYEGYAFKGGWTVIEAGDYFNAKNAFLAYHGGYSTGCFPCSMMYDEEEFARTGMAENGNLGAFEWERINFSRTIKDGTAR